MRRTGRESRVAVPGAQAGAGVPALPRPRARSPRRLEEAERQEILDTYATLLGRGHYVGSIRTMYRVLAEVGETRERRNQRTPHVAVRQATLLDGVTVHCMLSARATERA